MLKKQTIKKKESVFKQSKIIKLSIKHKILSTTENHFYILLFIKKIKNQAKNIGKKT